VRLVPGLMESVDKSMISTGSLEALTLEEVALETGVALEVAFAFPNPGVENQESADPFFTKNPY